MGKYVIGVDFGTDSCRALIFDASDGKDLASSVQYYARWKAGLYCDVSKNQYRQHPLDYIESMETAIKEILAKHPQYVADNVIGISFDMTGSTPAIVDEQGIPLALLDEFKENPNAMFVLWKDHTAIKEAEEINALARKWDVDYTAYEGGIYSSEWVWAKFLHILREDLAVRRAAHAWIEHTDWIPALLTGKTKPTEVIRSRCAAGHKAMWHESWGGLPSEEFLTTLSPLLAGFRSQLYTETFSSDKEVGCLTAAWAERLGLPQSVKVGVGAIDCHMGAVGAEIKAGSFVRVIGTSTCDVMVVPYDVMGDKLVAGICGQVDGSVLPGMIGLEAGQSAFGDIYAWFRQVLEWPLDAIFSESRYMDRSIKDKIIDEVSNKIIPYLSEEAMRIPIGENQLIATDWMNGRRTPDANQLLTGSIVGLTLGSSAPAIFRALVEATAYGSRAIVERFIANGIEIKEMIGIGGISQKSPFVMQTLADVLGMPIKVAKTEQAGALGAAMFAAVVAGRYATVQDAQKNMGQGFSTEYHPNEEHHKLYSTLYEKYQTVGAFSEKLA